jgi:nucleotide-binding universal stress UspA family protein
MRVLLALDGSDQSRTAADSLAAMPLPQPVTVRVLHVVTLPQALLEVEPVRAVNTALREQGRRSVNAARTALAPHFGDAEGQLLEGDPRVAIVELATQWSADLVVVGARGLGTIAGFLLGSVSRAVVHHAGCPVLVVKRRIDALRSVVLAVDGSPDSHAAARFVARLKLGRGSRVRLLAVAEPPAYALATPEAPSIPLVEAFEEDLRARQGMLREVLAGVDASLNGDGPVRESAVVVGAPGPEIVAAANHPGVDLVVVGARGLGAFKRLLLGSVSEHVLHHAACAVLVVKT